MRTLIPHDPFSENDTRGPWDRGIWPAKWITCPGLGNPPFVAAYRLRFTLEAGATVRVHVTADERYELFLDGERVGRGSERGDRNNWFFETYDLPIEKGEHILVARSWAIDDNAPYAQASIRPGFLMAAEWQFNDILGTGVAPWEAKILTGYEFVQQKIAWGTGANLVVHGDQFQWGFETGDGGNWQPAEVSHAAVDGEFLVESPQVQLLRPAILPAMMETPAPIGKVRFAGTKLDTKVPVSAADSIPGLVERWSRLSAGESIHIPANATERVVIDLENYYCAYPEIVTTGGRGSSVRIEWAESLYEKIPEGWYFGDKGNRSEIDGKSFYGVGDTFLPDGGPSRRFDTLWWQAGRYIQLLVETADEPLTIERVALRETRYPLEMEGSLTSSDDRLNRTIPIMLRGLQMCSHETYMDCPYYEQMMYIGDTRLEVLTTYAVTRDDRLPRKALQMFDMSRLPVGLTQSRYPARVGQVIAPFSLWWTLMVHDYAFWRDDPELVRELIPGVRAVLDAFARYINADGLVETPVGWNFIDWVPDWPAGMPLGADRGVSSIINWHYALALAKAAELEDTLGESELAERDRRVAREIAEQIKARFWDAGRGLYADDVEKTSFSEHAQCLAILSGLLDTDSAAKLGESMLAAGDLHRTTIYFTHYLFETYRVLGQIDALFDRLSMWLDLEERGFKTTFEMPEPCRSDCHAWGAHPLFHYYATILGIRPAVPGFAKVRIEPRFGPLTSINGTMPHPKGDVTVELSVHDGEYSGSVTLPDGVTGTLVLPGRTIDLRPGQSRVM
jgi:hypothetical protein